MGRLEPLSTQCVECMPVDVGVSGSRSRPTRWSEVDAGWGTRRAKRGEEACVSAVGHSLSLALKACGRVRGQEDVAKGWRRYGVEHRPRSTARLLPRARTSPSTATRSTPRVRARLTWPFASRGDPPARLSSRAASSPAGQGRPAQSPRAAQPNGEKAPRLAPPRCAPFRRRVRAQKPTRAGLGPCRERPSCCV